VGRARGCAAGAGRGSPCPGPSCCQPLRVDCDPGRGALASGLALPSLWRPTAFGCPSHRQTLTGGIGLRSESADGALSMVPRPDRRTVRTGPARGDCIGRWSIPVRPHQANGAPGKVTQIFAHVGKTIECGRCRVSHSSPNFSWGVSAFSGSTIHKAGSADLTALVTKKVTTKRGEVGKPVLPLRAGQEDTTMGRVDDRRTGQMCYRRNTLARVSPRVRAEGRRSRAASARARAVSGAPRRISAREYRVPRCAGN